MFLEKMTIRGTIVRSEVCYSWCYCSRGHIIIIIIVIIISVIIVTRPWPAFGRQGLVGSLFEYSYTRLASRLQRSARSEIMTLGNDKIPFQPSDLLIFQPFQKVLEMGARKNSLEYEKCLETGETTKSL